jgi:hypothetical protein
MSQTKTHSWFEVFSNIAIGMAINTVAQYIVFPLIGMSATHAQQIAIVVIFTIISIARQYILRRFWNWIMVRSA